MLNEGLENFKEDAGAQSEGRVQHLDLRLACAGRQGVVLDEAVRKDTNFENRSLNRLVHTA